MIRDQPRSLRDRSVKPRHGEQIEGKPAEHRNVRMFTLGAGWRVFLRKEFKPATLSDFGGQVETKAENED